MVYIFIVFLMIIAVVMAERYIKKVKSKPRLETEGIITKVIPAKFREDDSTFYFSYSVDGKDYNAMVSSDGAEGVDEKTPVGTKVTVFYVSDRPEDAYCRLK